MIPHGFDDFQEWVDNNPSDEDGVAVVVAAADYERFRDAMARLGAHRAIISAGAALVALTETAMDEATAAEALRAGEEDDVPAYLRPDVPWASVFRSHRVPYETAALLVEALSERDDPVAALLDALGLS